MAATSREIVPTLELGQATHGPREGDRLRIADLGSVA
jgi:hypothetical protein